MPGPIASLSSVISESIDTFHSCEDVREAWGCNGNSSQEYTVSCNTFRHVNGELNAAMESGNYIPEGPEGVLSIHINDMKMEMEEEDSHCQSEVTTRERTMTALEECQEDMEVSEKGGMVEGEGGGGEENNDESNVQVVEARLSLDINSALTRQKIASMQRGRTLSYADKDDYEESPTRRTMPLSHNRDSMELTATPPLRKQEATSSPSLPPKSARNIKISRNPSYHSAVRCSPSRESPVDTIRPTTPRDWSSSSEGSPGRESSPTQSYYENPDHLVSNKINAPNTGGPSLAAFKKNQPLDLPVAANMPRSASFSGGGILAPPSPPANGCSLSEAYGRRGSISQPSTPVTRRAQASLVLNAERTSEKKANIPVRGSAISKSFRRLFSTPVKSQGQLSPATSGTYPEDYWIDRELDSPTPGDSRPTSRLRKLSTSLTRKLSARSTSKMSSSYTFPSGANGHQVNGEALPDSTTLVDYEELMKLFTCSGCQTIMTPPLHQCRKGHLVCNTCRFSLKHVCPVCKQRFADATNMMMEQVCHLIKFPCKYSTSGCPEFHLPKSRLNHEHFCVYRPLHCHHSSRGCTKVLLLRDMEQHLDECEFKNK